MYSKDQLVRPHMKKELYKDGKKSRIGKQWGADRQEDQEINGRMMCVSV
jgi:hypothetical protein